MTAPLALFGARGGGVGDWMLAALHVFLLGALVFGEPGPRAPAPLRHGFRLQVLILLPLLYAELPLLMEGMPGPIQYHDPLVQAWESTVFGLQPAWRWAGHMPSLVLSEVLHAAYLLYYPIIYVPPLLLFARGREWAGELDLTLAALALSITSCFMVFVVFPVQGPRYLAAPPGVPEGPVRSLVLGVLEAGSSRGAAFPSSHVAVAVTQTLAALRVQRRVGVVLAVLTVLLAAGAVYGGFHYAVDALAGLVVGALAWGVALRLHGPDPVTDRATGGAGRSDVGGVPTAD